MFIDTPRVCKAVVFLSLSCLMTPLAHAQTTATTAQLRPALQILDTTKDQDGLVGSVRRVKTEYARINLKDGQPVEGPRQLLELTTYGVRGNRVDNVSYPIADSAIGREQYKYDERGNIIEKVLRDESGVVLSRESYEYVFDEVGNWTKMVTSLVVVENGEFKREPIEVTYRTVTYYAGDPAPRNVATNPPENAVPPAGLVANTERIEKTSAAIEEKPAVEEKPAAVRSRRRATSETAKNRSRAKETAEQRTGGDSELPAQVKVETPSGVPVASVNETAVPLNNSVEKPAPQTETAPASRVNTEEPSGTNGTVETAKRESPSETVNNPSVSEPPKKLESESARPPTETAVPTESATSSAGPTLTAATKALEIFQTGRQRFEAGDVSAAIDAYLESSRLLPGSSEIQLNLGHAYLTLKKDKDAIKAFKEAVKLNPQLAEAYYGLGFVSFRANKYKDAMDAFKKATVLTPEMAKAHYGLALAYIQLDKMDEMLQEYRLLQRLDSKLALKLSEAFPDLTFNCPGTRYCR